MQLGRRALIAAAGTGALGVGAAALGGSTGGRSGGGETPTIRVACGTTLYDSGLAEPLAALPSADAGEVETGESAEAGESADAGESAEAGESADAGGGPTTSGSVTVDLLPRGTGAALRAIEDGDAHVALVHHPEAERALVDAGDAVDRRALCANDFLIVGPADDPARVQDAGSVTAAFERVADADARFVSRGDNSGTHARERQIWRAADHTPAGEWYVETGASMGETVRIADTVGAYTLVDRGTYLDRRSATGLEAVHATAITEPPDLLDNVYHLLRATPDRIDEEANRAGKAFADLVTGEQGQNVIESFRIDGERAFRPTTGTDSSETARIDRP